MNKLYQIDPSLPIVFETNAPFKVEALAKLADLWKDTFGLPVMVLRNDGTGLVAAGAKPADKPPVMVETNQPECSWRSEYSHSCGPITIGMVIGMLKEASRTNSMNGLYTKEAIAVINLLNWVLNEFGGIVGMEHYVQTVGEEAASRYFPEKLKQLASR